MIHFYMIFYDEKTESEVPQGFIGLSNKHPIRKDLFEIEPILNFLTNTTINDDDLYGFLSPRVFEKSGLDISDFLSISEKSVEHFDIIAFGPGQILRTEFRNPIDQGEKGHSSFRRRFGYLTSSTDFLDKLNADDYINSNVPPRYFLLSHYFIAKGNFWKSWAIHVKTILAHESSDDIFRAVLNAKCDYDGKTTGYTYIIFLLERLAGLIAFSKNLSVYEYCLKKQWLTEFKKHNTWPNIIISISTILYNLEFSVCGEQRRPLVTHAIVTNALGLYTTIDKKLRGLKTIIHKYK